MLIQCKNKSDCIGHTKWKILSLLNSMSFQTHQIIILSSKQNKDILI